MDGSFPEIRELSSLAEGFPYMPASPRGVVYTGQSGACDPTMRDQYQRENPNRYATGFFRFTRAAGGELTLPSGQISVFQTGATESGAGTGGTTTNTALTRAETNAFVGGGVAKQSNQFIGVGLAATPLAPFIVATNDPAIGPQATRRRPNWFQGGTNYPAECLRLLMDTLTALALHGQDTACTYDFGPLAMWIDKSPVEGYAPTLGIPGQFGYLAIPDTSGNKTDGYNLQVNLTVNEGLRVDSDPLNPTVAGFDVVIPVRLSLVGFPICSTNLPGGAACGADASDIRSLVRSELKRAIAEMRKEMQGGQSPQLEDGKPAGRFVYR